ncbi:ABC transporter substrate-binding protein [Thiococcus pfennigii]|jgi:peptide/nickel transport system substrate-binding protein|uniref:ABC transporter substrate-binding protein n=1 Tax=Thiococcus pfennigii TaxID=1057 RepID=UPI001905FDBC|nr:ABC transporter substrate-binding protein [Thiococcus pfennigii]MBK1700161.1 ABC transporter substrate-binding protein [Thiococcus pfennigii]
MWKKVARPLLALALLAALMLLVLQGGGADRRAAGAQGVPLSDAALAERRGALVDEVVFTQEGDLGKISGLIGNGGLDVYGQGITNTTLFRRLRDSQSAAYDLAYGSSMEVTVNPVGPRFANGDLNPFQVPAIREALNWLIDRRHVADELYGGLAVPRFLPLSTAFVDYARLADRARALELRYRHDPERASAVIGREMMGLGARREGGRWLVDGEPVRIRVLIRTEDTRQQVGDYLANLLEDQGFTVERLYRTAEEASRIWIATDPAAGGWHLYTGGWVATAINRDESDNLTYYYTPRGRPEPLWQAYSPDPELDRIAERLERGDYASTAERESLLLRGLELAMRDSVRVWVVDQLNVAPRARELALATDLAGGVAGSSLWPYTLRFQGRLGGQVVFGVPNLLTEPWNPVAGSNWLYDRLITRGLDDPVLLPDPYTGLFWPQRIAGAEVTVQAGLPVARTLDWLTLETAPEIQVPADTWIDWDPAAGRFLTVGERHPEGLTARTRTRVQYEPGFLDRHWHDGSPMSLADVLLPWALTFERADTDSPLFDASYAPTFEVFQRHFRGWRIVSRAPLVIEIYSDQIYPDAETIVAARAPSVSPWHVLALGIAAERRGELAFSSDKADRQQVDWMSLVAGPSLAILERHLGAAREQGLVPYRELLGPYLTNDEPAARYRALADWYAARRHFWVGDGPFYLDSVRPVERNLVLRRVADFPDPADKWLRFTKPQIPELALDGPLVVAAGDGAAFTLGITYADQPYPGEAIEAARFLLFDGTGGLAAKGEAEPVAPGRWRIGLDPEQVAALGVGANRLEVAVTSRRVALPAFGSHVFATVPAAALATRTDAIRAGNGGAR